MRTVVFAKAVLLSFVLMSLRGVTVLAQDVQPDAQQGVVQDVRQDVQQDVPQDIRQDVHDKVAVYVTGNVTEEQKKTFGVRMLVALVNSGRYRPVERPAEFIEAVERQRAADSGSAVTDGGVCAIGKEFGASFISVTDIVKLSGGEYQILTRIIDAETAHVAAMGDFYGPIASAGDIKRVSEELLNTMFAAKGAPAASTEPKPEDVPPSHPQQTYVSPASAVSSTVAVAGEAKAVVAKVVAAVNAFKDATAKSMEAANAVKTAAQSKNFSAIMEAKKRVQSAVEAVKKAKTDVTAAIEALKAAGPDAVAAATAMGIDLSMFAGESETEGGEVRGGVKTDRADRTALRFAKRNTLPQNYEGGALPSFRD
jgi:hypothetical protein